ncbi:MAG: 23S rRNA (pseudouridine(1915)-N(3))-methyltransferase RlmH [Bosea sp. (in: a-proteobacteria)]
MRLCLLAVGRLKDGPERALCERYATRIQDSGRGLGVTGPELIEISESRARRPDDRKAVEAAAIRARRQPGQLIVLDERGKSMSSDMFASFIARSRDGAIGTLSLVIGGADGLDPSLRDEADMALSFGALTIPHQLVRALVLEQLYRALTILGGHPYHRS